jgi:uncharacterized alkaline shock family protein YloU
MTTGDHHPVDVEVVIADRIPAAVAAHAARAVGGVARLEVGVAGLIGQLREAALHRLGAQRPSGCDAGVRVRVTGDTVRIGVDIAVAGAPAVPVACAVQQAVTDAVEAATGLTVTEATVTIVDIAPPDLASAARGFTA